MSAAAPVPPAAPPRRRRRWPWIVLLALALLLAGAAALVGWVLTTSQGARFVLERVNRAAGGGITTEGVEGSLGGPLRLQALEVNRPGLYVRIEGLELDASPLEPLRGGRVVVNRLHAKSVEVRTVSKEEAARIPESFRPPRAFRLEDGRVGELRHGVLTPEADAEKDPARKRALIQASRGKDLVVNDIALRGEGDERQYRIESAAARTPYGSATLSGTLGTDAPFALDAAARVEGRAAERDYRADVKAKGTLRALQAEIDGVVSGQAARVRAALEPFAPVPVRTLEAEARDVDLSRHAEGLPRTRLAVEARLAATDGKAYAGPVRVVNAAPGPWDAQQLPFNEASARVVVTGTRIDMADLAIALAGGGSLAGTASYERGAAAANVRLANVDLSALHRGLQKTNVTGTVAAQGGAEAQRFEVALRDPRFSVDGRGALAGGRLEVKPVRVSTGGGAVAGEGTLALDGKREFRFRGRGERFDPSAFAKTAKGDLDFTFETSGTLEPSIAGEVRLDLSPSTYAGLPARGRVAVAGSRERIAKADVDLVLGEASVRAKGSYGARGDALDVAFRIPNLSSVAQPLGVRAAGRLEGTARLTGTFRSPAGRVELAGANLTLPSSMYVREVSLRGEAGIEPDSPIDATLQASGIALGEETPPTPFAETARVALRGTRNAHRLEGEAQMTKEHRVTLALQGGLDPRAKAPAWVGRVESLALTGRGAFTLARPAPLVASAERVELGDATLRGDWGEARLQQTRWTPKTLDVKGSSPRIEIRNLARTLQVAQVTRTNLVVAADWDIHAAETFNGTVSLKRLSGDLRVGEPPLPLGLTDLEVRADIVRNRARAVVRLLGERVGRVQGEGSAQLARGAKGWVLAPEAPVDARLVAEVPDVATLAPWLGPDAKAKGRLDAVLTVSGTGANPRIAGTAHARDLLFREPQTGFEIEQGQVALRFDGRSVAIEEFRAVTPWHPSEAARAKLKGMAMPQAGSLTATGSIDLEQKRGTIRVQAKQVPLTQLPTRFVAVTGEGQVQATAEGFVATGRFDADAGWIGALATSPPSVSEDVVVVRAPKPGAQPKPAPARGRTAVRLDVTVGLGNRLYFEGRGLDTRLAGNIQVTGDPASGLRARGVIRTEGGTYEGYGQKLVIERGVLQFQGPLENPRLDVRAMRKGLAVEAGVEVGGTVARPRARLVSVPDVPEPDKLSWLVLGRGPSDLAPGDASVLVNAAGSLLGRNNPADLTKRLGFDEVKIGRSDTHSVLGVLPQTTVAGRTGSASAAEVVSVGRKLTDDVHLTYEQGLADAEGALRVTWRISQQFQLLVRAGFLPGLDAVYRWTFK